MTRYVATVNVPGYLPMNDDPPVFDTAQEAWTYLVGVRMDDEDNDPDTPEYSQTVDILRYIASGEPLHRSPFTDHSTNADGTGTVYGDTPGYDGRHDLGLAYSVSVAEGE